MADPEVPTGKSILNTCKTMLGIYSTEETSFDTDIIAGINSAMMSLNQIGVGPDTPYVITGSTETYETFMPTNLEQFAGLEQYIYFKTRLAFDPPATSFAIDAIKSQIEELEYRFRLQAMLLEPPITT